MDHLFPHAIVVMDLEESVLISVGTERDGVMTADIPSFPSLADPQEYKAP
jgi:hypothetical protein